MRWSNFCTIPLVGGISPMFIGTKFSQINPNHLFKGRKVSTLNNVFFFFCITEKAKFFRGHTKKKT